MRQSSRRWVSSLLAVCLSLVGPTPTFARTSAPGPGTIEAIEAIDPRLRELAAEPWAPPPTAPWRAHDLDQDPFFMRAQSFAAPLGPPDARRTRVEQTAVGVRLQLAGTNVTLEVRQPLKPLAEIENYLFFQATDQRLFDERTPDGDGGLFFIDTETMYAALAGPDGPEPVPVFFLPLAGRWTGAVAKVAVEPFTTLAVRNERGEIASFDLENLRRFARVLRVNARLASLLALKKDPDGLARVRPGVRPFARPPRGSTAFFGTLLTGVDLDDPARGVARAPTGVSFRFDWLPRAHALVLNPDVWDRLYVTAMLSLGVYTMSTLFQLTGLRSRMLEVRAVHEEAEDRRRAAEGRAPPDRRAKSYRAKRFVRENVTVFSTGLSAFGSGAEVLAGYPLEYLSDRSGFVAAQSGWWRTLLEKTFLYYRTINEFVITNWKAFYLGVGILGSVDTTGVVLELLWLSPLAFPALAGLISPEMKAQVSDQFSGGDLATNDLVASEIMRNASVYWILGSYMYAGDQRSALMEIVRPIVERAFLKQGKNPHDPAFEREVNDQIEAQIERLMVERALPSRREFLFSSPSLVRALAGLIGYKVDPAELAGSKDFDGQPTNFILMRARHGLIADTFRRARAALLDDLARCPDARSIANAERLLAELQRRHEAVRLMARDPARAIPIAREAYKVNKILTLFTAEGLVGGGLKYMDLWTPEDPTPIARLIEIRRALERRFERQKRPLSKRRLYELMGQATLNEAPDVRLAFHAHAGRRRSLDSILEEVRADHASGVLGAALRDPRAAEYAGRAFRQSFFGLTANRPDWLRPTLADVDLYGAEARAEALRRLRAAPPSLGFDAADVELEALEIVKTKVAERELAARVAAWRPPAHDWLEAFKIAKAQREALLEVNRRVGAEGPLDIGEVAAVVSDGTARGTLVTDVYRETYRRTLANQAGLHPVEGERVDAEIEALAREVTGGRADGPTEARLERRRAERAVARGAREAADHDVAQNLETNSSWRAYVAKLDAVERLRFLTHQYAEAFLTRYVEMTVGNSALVPLTSPAQPGFFQKWRQAELPNRDTALGRALRVTLRVGDALFDATSVRPDVMSTLKRRVPFAQDVISDTSQRLRRLPILFGVTWWVNWYMWGVHYDLPTMLFFFGTGGLAQVAHYFVDRMLVNVGVPPMTGTWSKVKYSLLVTAFTYPSYVPFFFLEKGWRQWFYGTVDACQNLLATMF